MKRPVYSFLFVLVALAFLSACVGSEHVVPSSLPTLTGKPAITPTPTSNSFSVLLPQLILRPAEAIAYSHDLLIRQGYEHGLGYDNASYVPVEFPNGDRGAFVSIGFSGIARGYHLLYRIGSNQAELVELIASGRDWGIRSLQDRDKVDIETLELFADAEGQPVQLLKVMGAGHAGTGLWEHGYFQIIRITDAGMRVIFAFNGTEYVEQD